MPWVYYVVATQNGLQDVLLVLVEVALRLGERECVKFHALEQEVAFFFWFCFGSSPFLETVVL